MSPESTTRSGFQTASWRPSSSPQASRLSCSCHGTVKLGMPNSSAWASPSASRSAPTTITLGSREIGMTSGLEEGAKVRAGARDENGDREHAPSLRGIHTPPVQRPEADRTPPSVARFPPDRAAVRGTRARHRAVLCRRRPTRLRRAQRAPRRRRRRRQHSGRARSSRRSTGPCAPRRAHHDSAETAAGLAAPTSTSAPSARANG